MDPNACLERFLTALEEGDLRAAERAHADLTTWLAKGGFEPDWTDFDVDPGQESRGGDSVIDVTKEWFVAWSPGMCTSTVEEMLEAVSDAHTVISATRDSLVGVDSPAAKKRRLALSRVLEHLNEALAELEDA